jgi:hypothetical protein
MELGHGGCEHRLMVVGIDPWKLSMVLATFRVDFGDVSMNNLMGYGGPRFWVDLEALLSLGHHGDGHMGKKTSSS